MWKKFKAFIEKRRFVRKTKQLENDLIIASKFLKRIDSKMKILKWNRGKRRQFWRDFQKNELFREEVFDKMIDDKEEKK